MPATFTYPSAVELSLIEQEKLPVLTADDPIFKLFPIVSKDAARVEWEQKDNYRGLQQARGYNGTPSSIQMVGGNKYGMEPGVYGEHVVLDEKMLTERRKWGEANNQLVSLDDLVMDGQDQLLNRRYDRIRANLWTLLTTGTFSVYAPNGTLVHTDTFPLQTASAAVAWGTAATATPLADFRTVSVLGRGKSANFGAAAKAFMNLVTANKLLANSNAADLSGKLVLGGVNFTSINEVNQVLAGANLPQIEIMDDGYLNDSGTFVPFIAVDKVVVVGERTNKAPVGQYSMTRNVNNPAAAPGAYTRVIDRGEEKIPRQVEVHDGHNGGPEIWYPGSVVVLSV